MRAALLCATLLSAVWLAGWASPARARAEVTVVKANGTPVPVGSATVTFNAKSGGWTVVLHQLYAPGLNTVYEVHANGGETIDAIISEVNGPPAGSPLIIRALSKPPDGLRSVHGILQVGSAETLLNKVDVFEDIGQITVEAIGDLLAGRDIIGPITATTSDNPARGITTAQAGRNILGDLAAENGRILLAWAQGDIGTELDPVEIRAKHNVLHVMGQDVHAVVNTRVNGGTGGLWALVADRFYGSIDAEQLVFNPYNSMHGLVLVYQTFAGTISLGKSYNNPNQYIEVPPLGLGGQIIINADNMPGGVWTAPVRLGPPGHPDQIVLTGPNYPHASTLLGGGSVGLVPFRLHDESCSPPNGTLVQIAPTGPPLNVHLRHYGPVTWTGTAPPLLIDRRPLGSSGPFTAAPPGDFQLTPSNDSNNVVQIGPAPLPAGFAAGFAPGYQYRIRATNQLKCLVPIAPPVVWDADYLISVSLPPCDEDINGDLTVSVNDLILLINFWGPTLPAFPAPDINEDGQVNVNDLLLVINAWGPCW